MDFKINGENKNLVFGVRFVHELDKTQKINGGSGIEFGAGLTFALEKLESGMGLYDALADIIKCALHRENVTRDEVFDALDEYSEENDMTAFVEKIEEEVKNSNAVRAAQIRMEKTKKTASQKKGLQAVNTTKK